MVPTPATRNATTDAFITRATIQHGPRELLARYFLLADQRLKARGVTLTLASFDELLATNIANWTNWLPLTPTFNPTFNQFDPETAFCSSYEMRMAMPSAPMRAAGSISTAPHLLISPAPSGCFMTIRQHPRSLARRVP